IRAPNIALALALVSSSLLAQSPALHGIQTADLDRKVEPCTDFFEFANGAWRAANPIPASMTRWSRRWQAGDNAKGDLKEILEALPKENPQGSIEQQLADYYGACMDEKSVDARGAKPLAPWFAKIDAAKDLASLQAVM